MYLKVSNQILVKNHQEGETLAFRPKPHVDFFLFVAATKFVSSISTEPVRSILGLVRVNQFVCDFWVCYLILCAGALLVRQRSKLLIRGFYYQSLWTRRWSWKQFLFQLVLYVIFLLNLVSSPKFGFTGGSYKSYILHYMCLRFYEKYYCTRNKIILIWNN